MYSALFKWLIPVTLLLVVLLFLFTEKVFSIREKRDGGVGVLIYKSCAEVWDFDFQNEGQAVLALTPDLFLFALSSGQSEIYSWWLQSLPLHSLHSHTVGAQFVSIWFNRRWDITLFKCADCRSFRVHMDSVLLIKQEHISLLCSVEWPWIFIIYNRDSNTVYVMRQLVVVIGLSYVIPGIFQSAF